MNKKIVIVFVLGALIIGGAFLLSKKQTDSPEKEASIVASNVDTENKIPRFLENAPNIKTLIDSRYQFEDLNISDWDTYKSPTSGFTVKIPKGTEVKVLQEQKYTITRFTLKDTVHVVDIDSYEGEVYQGNLDSVLARGDYWSLTGENRFSPKNQFQCMDEGICFLSSIYADKSETDSNPPLVMLHADVFNKNPYPFFYQIKMGDYHPALTTKELGLYSAILKTLQFSK